LSQYRRRHWTVQTSYPSDRWDISRTGHHRHLKPCRRRRIKTEYYLDAV